jgi:hypothetical protein
MKKKILKKDKKNINKILRNVDDDFPKNLIEVEQIDYARDGYHFDLLTGQNIVKEVVKYIE